MTTPAPSLNVGPDTLITVKIHHNDNTRRFKIPLRDLGARVLPQKLRQLLGVQADYNVIFERFSDSAGRYVRLDSENLAAYKQLYRAAKAKSKLRIKAIDAADATSSSSKQEDPPEQEPAPSKASYLDTVLSPPLPTAQTQAAPSSATGLASYLGSGADNAASSDQPRQSLSASAHSNEASYRETPPYRGCLPVAQGSPSGAFFIDCNHCTNAVINEHYHCSICENGDYDLCLPCVKAGVTCKGDEHWMIRRFIRDGVVVNATTETISCRKPHEVKEDEKKPAEAAEAASAPTKEPEAPPAPLAKADERICNSCLNEFDETNVVTCSSCVDYDLCMACLLKNSHGHNPSHEFSLLHDREFYLRSLVQTRCSPGRHYSHAAICDGCEKRIYGVRHKCLACPDWDFCSECFADAASIHPNHRFVPVYEAIAEPPQCHEVHYGIFCDGPLCRNKPCPSYLTGARYKCTVCYDTDFCAKCEALPTNTHNRTHPLVMFKTPIRSVNISMMNEDDDGRCLATLGDRSQKSTSTQADAPIERDELQPKAVDASAPEKVETSREEEQVKTEMPASDASGYGYDAFFIREAIADGTVIAPNQVFQQTWTLYNPGPLAWPAGSDVRFVGGDSMFDVDTGRASSIDSITSAMGSNKLSAPLESGQSAQFAVTLRAPNREGTSISYWRLKLANGMPFGHRLWCDVRVQGEPAEPEKAASDGKEADAEQNEGTESCMIFPTLDKESPETSTHGAMAGPAAPSVSNPSENDVVEDMESLTMGEDGTEGGFVTDEEYDVLDASDQEFQDAKAQK